MSLPSWDWRSTCKRVGVTLTHAKSFSNSYLPVTSDYQRAFMIKLRKFIAALFPFLAIISLAVACTSISHALTVIHGQQHVHLLLRKLTIAQLFVAALFTLLSRMTFFLPAVLAFFYGMAWWKTASAKPSSRLWTLAASAAISLQALPVIVAVFLAESHMHASTLLFFLPLPRPMSGPGYRWLDCLFPAKRRRVYPETGSTDARLGQWHQSHTRCRFLLFASGAMWLVSTWFYRHGSPPVCGQFTAWPCGCNSARQSWSPW